MKFTRVRAPRRAKKRVTLTQSSRRNVAVRFAINVETEPTSKPNNVCVFEQTCVFVLAADCVREVDDNELQSTVKTTKTTRKRNDYFAVIVQQIVFA
jgi:hypothetical protein